MVEWSKGELLYMNKSFQMFVMFYQCAISFGNQKFHVKSGF